MNSYGWNWSGDKIKDKNVQTQQNLEHDAEGIIFLQNTNHFIELIYIWNKKTDIMK